MPDGNSSEAVDSDRGRLRDRAKLLNRPRGIRVVWNRRIQIPISWGKGRGARVWSLEVDALGRHRALHTMQVRSIDARNARRSIC